MDLVRVNARDVKTGEIIVVAIAMNAPGVSVIDTWDTLSMRATASNDLVLDDVRLPASSIGVRLSPDAPAWDPAFAAVIKWFLAGITSVYVEIADHARDAALETMGGGANSSHLDEALTDVLLGELEVAHLTASATLQHSINKIQAIADAIVAMKLAITMKEVWTNAAIDVVDRAVNIVGGKAFHRRSILERLARDVRAARHHPPSAPVAQQMIGIATRDGIHA